MLLNDRQFVAVLEKSSLFYISRSSAANALNFKVESNLAFEIPLTNVMNATAAKNEVTVEFHPNDDAPVSLIEVRFHIPPNPPEIETDAVEVSRDVKELALNL